MAHQHGYQAAPILVNSVMMIQKAVVTSDQVNCT
jgi:hypothetical protein